MPRKFLRNGGLEFLLGGGGGAGTGLPVGSRTRSAASIGLICREIEFANPTPSSSRSTRYPCHPVAVLAERSSHSQQTSIAGTTRSSREDVAAASDGFGRVPTPRNGRVAAPALAQGWDAEHLRVETLPVRGDAVLHSSQPHRAAADDPVQRVLEPVLRPAARMCVRA